MGYAVKFAVFPLLIGICLAVGAYFVWHTPIGSGQFPGKAVEDFALLDHRGNLFELYRGAKVTEAKAIVLISTGIGCPIAENGLAKVQELARAYGAQKIGFALVDSTSQDGRPEIEQWARDFSLPVLLDQSQFVADALAYDRTAHATVIETASWKIIYQGAIDDRLNYADAKAQPKHDFLRDALEDFLAGRDVRMIKTEALGCAISRLGWPKQITYQEHVRPILEAKCVACHHPGGNRPENISTYSAAVGWAAMMREVVRNHRMPLEAADSYYTKYEYDFSLTPEETGLLVKWAESGVIEGKVGKPSPPQTPTTRPIRTDFTLGPVTIDIPAQGDRLKYTKFLGQAPRDLWIVANERDLSKKGILHHMKLVVTDSPQTILETQGNQIAATEKDEGMGAAVIYLRNHGFGPETYPPGMAVKIAKGSYIYLEQHVGLTGREEKLTTAIRLQLGNSAQLEEMKRVFLTNTQFTIPAGAKNFPLTQEKILEHDIELLRILPHMHKRGQSIRVTVRDPAGKESVLISVPRYLYDRPRTYTLLKPVRIAKGSTIRLSGVYDNSETNPNHIDVTKPISFGLDIEQQEMLFLVLDYRSPR